MQAFKLFFFIIIAFTCSCGRKVEAVKVKKIGIDKSFYPYVDISAYIIGFIDDLLMDFSKNSGYVLELVSSNMEDLMYDIENERLDAIISFNDISIDKLKTLEYSDIFLNTSFILITNENNKDDFYLSNTKVSIAIPYEECSTQLLQENPNIFLINYKF